MALISFAYFLSVVLESFLFCHPIAFNWDKSIDGTCTDPSLAYLMAAITNLLIDAIIVLLPIPVLWTLQMPLFQKVAITGMFSLGLL